MPARKPGRYLALLALVAVVVATALVVRSGLGTTHHATTTRATQVPSTRRVVPTRRRFYFIRAGDTLSSISVRTGVPVAQLQALNSALASDPNALQTGQRLRLR